MLKKRQSCSGVMVIYFHLLRVQYELVNLILYMSVIFCVLNCDEFIPRHLTVTAQHLCILKSHCGKGDLTHLCLVQN